MKHENQLLVLCELAIRQIDLLLERKSELIDTIHHLKAFIRTATEMSLNDPGWADEFFEAWVDLEVTYAMASAEERTQLSADEVRLIEDTCLRMRTMLQTKIAGLSEHKTREG